MQGKRTIWIRLRYSLFFTITGLFFVMPPDCFTIPYALYKIIERFFNPPFHNTLAILISLSVIAVGFTIVLLKNWSRLIAVLYRLNFCALFNGIFSTTSRNEYGVYI